MRKVVTIITLALAVAAVGCTTKKTEAPPLTGPSGFALQLTLQSVPDSILQDGTSQSAIQIDASGPDARPVRGLGLRVETALLVADAEGNEVPRFQDYGTLSAKTVVTGEDGRARVTFTAPPRPADQVDRGTIVRFYVTPIGNDYQGEQPRFVSLRLVPPGIILPPNEAPGAAFDFSPTTPTLLQDIVFDASSSVDGPVIDQQGNRATCGAVCKYQWDFGDGGTASGVFVTHRFQRLGVYLVRLTVTDAQGASATITRAVNIGQGEAPAASFTYSPSNPAVSQDIFFNAGASTAATGRRIIAWEWDFGSGRTASGMTVTKRYDTAGTYVVSLAVEDDSGAIGRTTQSVTVGATGTGPQARLTVSPTGTGSVTNADLFFDGRTSSGPSPITFYRFTFGDGSQVENTTGTATHRYTSVGQYVASLTVRDSQNRTATVNLNVTVTAPTP